MAIDSISLSNSTAAGQFSLSASSRFSLAVAETNGVTDQEGQDSKAGSLTGQPSGQAFMLSVFNTLAQFDLDPPRSAPTSKHAGETQTAPEASKDNAMQDALHSFVHELMQAITPAGSGSLAAGQSGELRLQLHYSADIVLRVQTLKQQLTKDAKGQPANKLLEQLHDNFRKLVDLIGSTKTGMKGSSTDKPETATQAVDLASFLDKLVDNLRASPDVSSELPTATGNVVDTAA
jgi:hypothetical protein